MTRLGEEKLSTGSVHDTNVPYGRDRMGPNFFSRLCAYAFWPNQIRHGNWSMFGAGVRHRKTTFRELIQFYCQKSAVSSQHRSVNINAVENGTLADSRCGDEEVEEPKKLRRADCDSPIDLHSDVRSATSPIYNKTTPRDFPYTNWLSWCRRKPPYTTRHSTPVGESPSTPTTHHSTPVVSWCVGRLAK